MQKITLTQLVLDQLFRSQMIGHPQQSLGKHHQGQTLGCRECIGPQQILDAADPMPRVADGRNQRMTQLVDLALLLCPQISRSQPLFGKGRIINRIRQAKGFQTHALRRCGGG